jgi:hypothetical protein
MQGSLQIRGFVRRRCYSHASALPERLEEQHGGRR